MFSRIGLILMLSTANCWALSEENYNEKFDLAPGGKLLVEVDFGTVDVSAGNDNEVTVQAHRKIEAGDKARENAYVASVPISITKEGNDVIVRAFRPKNSPHVAWSGNVEMDAEYTVKVPKNFNAQLKTGGGAITASGLQGDIMADSAGGKLKFAQLRGPIDARTSGGSVALEACDGDIHIFTAGGEIDSQGGAGTLEARTAGGSIAVRNFGGSADLKTSGGKIIAENIKGEVTGKSAAGAIVASLADPIAGDVSLQTSAGSIYVSLPPKAGVNVEARAGMGKVRTEIPMLTHQSSDDRLVGTLNGGGKSLLLNTSVGSIAIRPNDTAAASAADR